MKIRRIEKLQEKQLTVDVEVEGTHSYQLSNGWVSHNTVSQLVDCSSGIHARESEYFIRNVRADKKDPLAQMMEEMGFPCEDDVQKPQHNWVFGFPVKSPDCAVTVDDMTALEHLELWKDYQLYWCEHKPSCTIRIREHEWFEVGAWVYRNFDVVSGISFLPYSGHVYKQAPYQRCTKKEYEEALAKMPKNVSWAALEDFEKTDEFAELGMKTYACGGGDSCEIVDIIRE